MKRPYIYVINKKYPAFEQVMPNFYGVGSLRPGEGGNATSAPRRSDEADARITVLTGPPEAKHSDMLELLEAVRGDLLDDESADADWPTMQQGARRSVFEDLLSSVLGFGYGLISGDDDNGFNEAKWEQHAKDDIAAVIRIDRSELDDIDTFYADAISAVERDSGWFERFIGQLRRSGLRLLATLARMYARVTLNLPVDDPTSSSERSRLAVRLFLQNVARKYGKRRNNQVQKRYVIIWVERANGWSPKTAKESPIFDALVHYLWREDLRREIGLNGVFHLIISGHGDTRYILDTLGVDPRGRHHRIQYWDPNFSPVETVRGLIKSHLEKHLNSLRNDYIDSEDKFSEFCDICCGRNDESYGKKHVTDPIALAIRSRIHEALVASSGSIGASASVPPELSDFRDALNEIEQYIKQYADAKPLEELLKEVGQVSKYIYWGKVDLICLVVNESIKWYFQYHWWRACQAACKALCKESEGMIACSGFGESLTVSEGLPNIKELIICELRPIVEDDANTVLVNLEQAGCTDFACSVAKAMDSRYSAKNGIRTLSDGREIISVGEVRSAIKRTLDNPNVPCEGRSDDNGRAGLPARSIDEVIALLFANGMLHSVFGEPYDGYFAAEVYDTKTKNIAKYKYIGEYYHIVDPLVQKKLLELAKGAEVPVGVPTGRKFIWPNKK